MNFLQKITGLLSLPLHWQHNAESNHAAEFLKITKEIHRKKLDKAYEDAKAGTGSQDWDAGWFENERCFAEETEAFVCKWSWQQVQTLREILNWALASPQGQRALHLCNEESSPWQGTLDMIESMKQGLNWKIHALLIQHAKKLQYNKEKMIQISDDLDILLYLRDDDKDAST